MNIRDLKYLVALAEYKHFGKAAEACFVSQPALSMQIQKLEKMLDIKLLERTNKSVLFTEDGLAIAKRAHEIVSQVDGLLTFAKLRKDPYRGELRIGIFPTLAPYLLPLIIPALSKKFPYLTLFLVEEQTEYLLEKLRKGKLDIAFLALPLLENCFTKVSLFDEEFLLAVPKDHSLAKLHTVKQTDLDHQHLLLLEEGHCLRDQALALCYKLNVKETQNFRATSLETLRHMVASGIGSTLMPKLACSNNKNISYIPFSSPKPVRSICLAWRDTSAKQHLFMDMADRIKMILSKHNSVKIIP